jgi:hypothetical protein
LIELQACPSQALANSYDPDAVAKAAIAAPQVLQYSQAGKPAKTRFSPNSHGARFCDGRHSGREQDEVRHSCDQQYRIGNMDQAACGCGAR